VHDRRDNAGLSDHAKVIYIVNERGDDISRCGGDSAGVSCGRGSGGYTRRESMCQASRAAQFVCAGAQVIKLTDSRRSYSSQRIRGEEKALSDGVKIIWISFPTISKQKSRVTRGFLS
jgi:hypothetical protein